MWNDFNTGDHNGMIAETIDIKGKDDQPLRVYYSHPLKKKENPALLPPNFELVKNKDNAFVCCVHHSQMPVTSQEKDPRNYQGMPPCMMASIIPAGKPSHVVAPLNIFENDNY